MFSVAPRSALLHARTRLTTPRTLSAHQQSLLSKLLSTLAILEQREGKLQPGSLSAVTAAKKLGGSITGFVAGSQIKSVAEEAAKVEGIEKILSVENQAYDKGLPENYAPLLVENIKKGGYTHVIAPHSAFGKNLIPRVAALLDSQQLSDVTGIESEDSKYCHNFLDIS
jgi:electron transfer flavoprotein alpha subunit